MCIVPSFDYHEQWTVLTCWVKMLTVDIFLGVKYLSLCSVFPFLWCHWLTVARGTHLNEKKKCSEHRNNLFNCNLLFLMVFNHYIFLITSITQIINFINISEISVSYVRTQVLYRQRRYHLYKSYHTSHYWQNVRHVST